MILNIINFADVARREKDESFMVCEESFIIMKLIWHSYLVPSLGIWVHETPIETGLVINLNVKIDVSAIECIF